MVVEAVPVGEVEPRVLRLVEVGQPARSASLPARAAAESLLVVALLDGLRHAELEREPGEALELLVRTQDEEVDARDHLRDRLVRDVRERLPAELVEDEVGAVAEVQELEVVLQMRSSPSSRRS